MLIKHQQVSLERQMHQHYGWLHVRVFTRLSRQWI